MSSLTRNKILIAEDDEVSRRLLGTTLQKWGYETVAVGDGSAAWEVLREEAAPPLAILDWMMPRMDGIELCRKVRELSRAPATYIILLTARDDGRDLVRGLEAGADDYITKPFNREELRARIQVGLRVVRLQQILADRVRELAEALTRVKRLQGLLPICSYCKKIRNDRNYWEKVETYISEHSEAQFSHGICPDCFERVVKPELHKMEASREKP
jgi:DNA-binding response OmpR family regulator